MGKAILMNTKDTVATALEPILKGDHVDILFQGKVLETIRANQDIDIYHKISRETIPVGTVIYKYGEVIGKSTKDISKGDYVHVQNIESVMVQS